jgi:hypothetical protein
MRVSILALPLLLAACSSAPPGVIDHSRGVPSNDTSTTEPERKNAPQAKPSPPGDDAPPPPATPPPATDAGAPPPPPPAQAPPGSCGNPKCVGGGGLCGCKATDSAGTVIALGCDDTGCGCFVNDQLVAATADTCTSPDEAAAIFASTCGCN